MSHLVILTPAHGLDTHVPLSVETNQGGAGDPAELDGDVPGMGSAREVEEARRFGTRAAKGGQLLEEAFFGRLRGAVRRYCSGWRRCAEQQR